MTPAEKAKELVDKFTDEMIECDAYFVNSGAKQCALIAVEEIVDNYEDQYKYCKSKLYWEEVKQEIEKL